MLPAYPSYESEVKECDDIFKSIMRFIKRQPNYDVDYVLVKNAYEKAKELHGNTRRHSGVLYLRHPLAVMESLAHLKCKTSILAASLLHDTMEDCGYAYENLRDDFKDEIAEIVSAVTAIKTIEKEAESAYYTLSDEDKHDYLDRLTDAKLIKSGYQREAFLVRFADREHNLSTIDACKAEKRRLKIEGTKSFLIPAAQRLGMRYYATSLSDYCMKFADDPIDYLTLLSQRNDIVSISGPAYSEMDAILSEGVKSQTNFHFPPYNPFARMRGGKKDGNDSQQVERRRLLKPYEIKEQLNTSTGSVACINRNEVYLSEILLVCDKQDLGDMLSHFIDFFNRFLKPHTCFFRYIDSDNLSIRIMLMDKYENVFLLVLVPAHNLELYFLGDANDAPLTMVDEQSVNDALRPKITVYAYSGYRPLRRFDDVPSGATALDFAFKIGCALAYTVTKARIKKCNGAPENVKFTESDYKYHLKTVLEDGDVVFFETNYPDQFAKPQVKIQWFNYINTEYARNRLIDYFSSVLPEEFCRNR